MTRFGGPSSRRVGAAALGLVLPLVTLAVVTPAAAQADPSVAVVTVDVDSPGREIPADFLGLSFEANLMHEQWLDPGGGNVPTLIANLGEGNLRFSANQVDRTAWIPTADTPVPDWAQGQIVTPEDLTRVGDLARSIGWSIDMGVNFGQFDPAAAADQARSARERIGPALRSVQIGNEPNVYIAAPVLGGGDRHPLTPESYVSDARAYREAIAAAAPGLPIEGPDTAGAGLGVPPVDAAITDFAVWPWLQNYTAEFSAQSRFLNQHYYPFVNVAKVGVPSAVTDTVGGLPTADSLLEWDTSHRQSDFIRRFVATAEHAGLAPVLSETNSVAKEGRAGVTDTFANALWTADYLMTAAREGIAGVNLHMQPGECESYTLFCFEDAAAREAGTARPNPNYYAALAFSQLTGGQILPTTVEAGGAHVSALAVRMPDGAVKVLVDNLDSDFTGEIAVTIAGEPTGAQHHAGTVYRLTAPTPESLDGTTFGGAVTAPDGSFSPQDGVSTAEVDGSYRMAVDRPGAALLTVS